MTDPTVAHQGEPQQVDSSGENGQPTDRATPLRWNPCALCPRCRQAVGRFPHVCDGNGAGGNGSGPEAERPVLTPHEEILRTLDVIPEPGAIVEARVLGLPKGQVASGYYDREHFDTLAGTALGWGENAAGVYMPLNPPNPALLARAANRVLDWAKHATADADIQRWRWMMIDHDPVRPSGVSSTDPEHLAALARAREVREWLVTEISVPRGSFIRADSGNGAHLLVRVDLPNEAPSTALVQRALQALDLQFSDEAVKLDVATFHPGQLGKLYGTKARKGDPTPDRPHRWTRLLEIPADIVPVPREALERLAALSPEPPKTGGGRKGQIPAVGKWLGEHGVAILKSKSWNGGTLYTIECPWRPQHGAKARVIQFANGALSAGCFHPECVQETWATLRERLEPNAKGGGGDDRKREKKPSIEEVVNPGTLFHSTDGDDTAYATISVNGHRETWPVRSHGYKQYITREYYLLTDCAPSAEDIRGALLLFEAQARFDGPAQEVSTRVARQTYTHVPDVTLYLDLCNQDWEAVEITTEGWRVVADPPVRFRRTRGMRPLPSPERGGTLDELWNFVNITDAGDRTLFLGDLLGAFHPTGPYPALVLQGEQGSAKTFAGHVYRALTDPNKAPLRSLPREERDLAIAASNGRVVAFDNVSNIPDWLSDALCRVATGGGFGARELYTDDEEKLFEFKCPIILTGIDNVVVKGDLLDRSVILTLPVIDTYRNEKTLGAEFEAARPRLFGALLDAVVLALRRETDVSLDPVLRVRMIDWVCWAMAAEPAFGCEAGTFLSAYLANREGAAALTLEASPLATIFRQWWDLYGKPRWEDTTTALWGVLNDRAERDDATGQVRRIQSWPKNAAALGHHLRRLAPALRRVGIALDFGRDAKGHTIHISPRAPETTPAPVAGPLQPGKSLASLSSPTAPTASSGPHASDASDDSDSPPSAGATGGREPMRPDEPAPGDEAVRPPVKREPLRLVPPVKKREPMRVEPEPAPKPTRRTPMRD